jgi:hypothetical protein
MRGVALNWLVGLVLLVLYAVVMGAIAIGGGTSFFVGLIPGLLIGFWGLITIQRELSRKGKDLDDAVGQGLSSQQCLQCGRPVKVGLIDCPHCGFTFRTSTNELSGGL